MGARHGTKQEQGRGRKMEEKGKQTRPAEKGHLPQRRVWILTEGKQDASPQKNASTKMYVS